jgi:hypothetical protein
MVIQYIDGTLVDSSDHANLGSGRQVFYTEIAHDRLDSIDGWIDRLIGYAFETLDAQHVELHVVDPDK